MKRIGLLLLGLCWSSLAGGCAAVTNPAAEGIPVRRVPTELLAYSRSAEQTIPLPTLRQPPPDAYRLGPGDVLGVHVDGITGTREQTIPLHVASPIENPGDRRLDPSLGFPVTVQADGTIVLPLADPLSVQGMTLVQANDAIRKMYVKNQRLKPDLDRSIVTLIQPRTYKVLVFRQEAANFSIDPSGSISTSKRGSGHLVELRAYENDVLHALAKTGGFPGLDAYNEVVIYRGCFQDTAGVQAWMHHLGQAPVGQVPHAAVVEQPVIRIPLRLPPGAPLPYQPQDVILQNGDVVFLEARDNEVFYTAGLLPAGTHVLPRDEDLDVLEAIAQARGPLFNGAFGGSNLSGAFIQDGIGNPSPTLVTVLRRTPGGGQVPILVDLNQAVQDPRERIVIQPQDVLILQEKPEDALVRFFTQTFFNFDFLWQPIHETFATGVIDVSIFNRSPDRFSNVNIDPR